MLLFHIFTMSGFYSFCTRYKGHLLKGEQNRIIYLTTRLKYRVDHVIKVRVKRDVPSVLSSCFLTFFFSRNFNLRKRSNKNNNDYKFNKLYIIIIFNLY